MEKIRVLFLCIHNTSRSQMAEAFLRSLAGESSRPTAPVLSRARSILWRSR